MEKRSDDESRLLHLRNRVLTMAPTPRIERLRRRYLDTPNKAVVIRSGKVDLPRNSPYGPRVCEGSRA